MVRWKRSSSLIVFFHEEVLVFTLPVKKTLTSGWKLSSLSQRHWITSISGGSPRWQHVKQRVQASSNIWLRIVLSVGDNKPPNQQTRVNSPQPRGRMFGEVSGGHVTPLAAGGERRWAKEMGTLASEWEERRLSREDVKSSLKQQNWGRPPGLSIESSWLCPGHRLPALVLNLEPTAESCIQPWLHPFQFKFYSHQALSEMPFWFSHSPA